mmetsp:Transcript_8132/g.13162  ORF Transcript_8132/g.13162 Transcript_8132/m.13162 type:complete len:579 (+) Transcript_8132:149-1885(+)
MPVTPQYTWNETDREVFVQVPIKNAKNSKTDIECSDAWLKINFPPSLLQLDLFDFIDDEKSRIVVEDNVIKCRLVKREERKWGRLNSLGDKEVLRKRREESIQRRDERLKKQREELVEKRRADDKYTFEKQWQLDKDQKAKIEQLKQQEKEEIEAELFGGRASKEAAVVQLLSEQEELKRHGKEEDKKREGERANNQKQEKKKKQDPHRESHTAAKDQSDTQTTKAVAGSKSAASTDKAPGDSRKVLHQETRELTSKPSSTPIPVSPRSKDEGHDEDMPPLEEVPSHPQTAKSKDSRPPSASAPTSSKKSSSKSSPTTPTPTPTLRDQAPPTTRNSQQKSIFSEEEEEEIGEPSSKSSAPAAAAAGAHPIRQAGTVTVKFTEVTGPGQDVPARESVTREVEEAKKRAKAPKNSDARDISEENPVWLKDKGDKFFQSRDYTSAINAYTAALAIDPTMVSALSNRAASYLSIQCWNQCIEDCSTALDLVGWAKSQRAGTPMDLEGPRAGTVLRLLCRRGSALAGTEQYKEAVDDYGQAIMLDPENEALRYDLDCLNSALQLHDSNMVVGTSATVLSSPVA